MAKIEIQLTLKQEKQETTFLLCKNDAGFYLKGYSSVSGEKEIALKRNENTKVFELKQNGIFSEDKDTIYSRLLDLTFDWNEIQDDGLELDDELPEGQKAIRYSPDDIYVERRDFTISSIMEYIDDGDLEISPMFQRHFIWDKKRQSNLIESILLGLPLPSIYMSQYKDGRLTIIDGLQRISTIKRFMKDELELSNMEYFPECNGKKYSELKDVIPLLLFRKIRQTQLMCFLIDYRSPAMLKYDLFRRLNTGGKSLNDQEVRNCLSRPRLQKLLWDMIVSPEFVKATNGSVKDTRMVAQECALRFIYFYDQYSENNFIGKYDGNMRDSLNGYIEVLNSLSQDELNMYIEPFKKSMQMAYDLFGEYAFRKIDLVNNKKLSVNKSLMLVISVLLAHHYDKYLMKVRQKVNLVNNIAKLLETDIQLVKAITSSTADKANILYTMSCLKNNLFDKYLL